MGYVYGVSQGTILRAVCGLHVPAIDRQHHIRKVDDLLVGVELCVRRTDLTHSGDKGAFLQHRKVAFPQVGRPFCSLLLMWYVANEHQVSVGCTQAIDDFARI